MDKKDIAERLASVLDELSEYFENEHYGYDYPERAIDRAVVALDELYRDMWREDNTIPGKWWVSLGSLDVWTR